MFNFIHAHRNRVCAYTATAAKIQWTSVADQLRAKFPRLGALMEGAEIYAPAFMTLTKTPWTQSYSTNPLERLDVEVKRPANVVSVFPNDASITRLVGAMMLEQNDEWCLNRRYMQLEGWHSLCDALSIQLSARAR